VADFQPPIVARVQKASGIISLKIVVGSVELPAPAAAGVKTDVPNQLTITLPSLKATFEPLPGHVSADLESAGAVLVLTITAGGAVQQAELFATAKATARVRFNLFYDTDAITLGIPLTVSGTDLESKFAFRAEFSADANVDAKLRLVFRQAGQNPQFAFFEAAERWVRKDLPAGVAKLERQILGFGERALLGGAEALTSVVEKITVLESWTAKITKEGLEVAGIGAEIALRDTLGAGSRKFLLTAGAMLLDKNWKLKVTGEPRLAFKLEKDELLLRGNATVRAPLSLHFHAGTTVMFSLDPRQPYVALGGGTTTPATVYVPGLRDGEFNTDTQGKITPKAEALKSRFQLTFDPDQPDLPPGQRTFCRLSPEGARMTARAVPRPITIGTAGSEPLLRSVQLDHGHLTLDRGDYDLEIAASAQLGFFEQASGRLTVRANSRTGDNSFAARFDVKIEGAWEDPTGTIEFRDPGASVELALGVDGWTAKAWVSGTVHFKATQRWLSSAADWLGDLFGDLALRFERLALHDLLENPLRHLRLKIQSTGGKQLKLWNLLKFELTEFGLARDSVILAGKVHFTLEGGFYFMGSIPRLRISLRDGIDFDDEPGAPMVIEGKLVTPTGITAAIRLERERNALRERLAGQGSLLIPGWPGITITCGFGRRRPNPQKDDWIPLLFLFVEADIPITLFPCVVLRDLGLGFGINQKLRGFSELWAREDAFDELMKDPRGLPNPANVADWVDGGGENFTDVALVARTHVAPSPDARGPFPYVADAMLYIQPTSEFTIAFTSNLWLFTGLDDTRDAEFRARPLVQTLIVMYPRHGYLEARSRTRRDSKMKAVPDAVAKALSLVETEMTLKATPDMFRLRVGLMQVGLRLGLFDLSGTLLFGVELGNGVAIMLMQQTLAGRFELDWRFGVSLGPLSIEVGLAIHARMGYSILQAGGYFGRELGVLFYGVARIHISIEMKVHLALRFHLRIKIGWFKITISWSKRLSASLAIAFEAEVEALIGTSGLALTGTGTLHFRCCGYSFSPRISFSIGNTDRLSEVRARLRPFLPASQNALN
jgi:hypothetical protein